MLRLAYCFRSTDTPTLRRLSTARTSPVVLRPYQESCVNACLNALNAGSVRIGVSLPTGSGKTTVFIHLLSKITPPADKPNARRSLVIVNSVELARQTAVQAHKMFLDWTVEIEQGVKYHASGQADITIATYQTLLRTRRLAKFDPNGLKAIIVDEAHHAAAPTYRRILSHFHPAVKKPDSTSEPPQLSHAVPILGFSATFSRYDDVPLEAVFERIVYHRDFLEMISEGWLCNVRFTCIRADIGLHQVAVHSETGDFNAVSLAKVINTDPLNKLVVQTWFDKAATRKSTLVFCADLAHVRNLTSAFQIAGIDARYIYFGTPAVERKELVDAFKAGQFPVLVNCAVLTEGADIPSVVVVARPTRSLNVFAQMIGRGMRFSPTTGKEDCRIIDFVDSKGHVSDVVCTLTLFGLDPSEVIDDETIGSLRRKAALNGSQNVGAVLNRGQSNIPFDLKPIATVDYEDPNPLVNQGYGAPYVQDLSDFAWVGCGDDTYVLECLSKGHIRIGRIQGDERLPSRYQAHYFPLASRVKTEATLQSSSVQKVQEISMGASLIEAIEHCDNYATTRVKGLVAPDLRRLAKWRHQPATDKQRQFVESLWKSRPRSALGKEGNEEDAWIQTLTKGEAANIITRTRRGAQIRYEVKGERKLINGFAKEGEGRAREGIKVGPLSPAG
ncbi:hypothetical protein AcV7_010099 [Taiwanofungus camphoratus]|nr:hypothetical protein AcV7_010099 [Antrodia cinnamomea]